MEPMNNPFKSGAIAVDPHADAAAQPDRAVTPYKMSDPYQPVAVTMAPA